MNSSANTSPLSNKELVAAILLDLSRDSVFSPEYQKSLKLAAARRIQTS